MSPATPTGRQPFTGDPRADQSASRDAPVAAGLIHVLHVRQEDEPYPVSWVSAQTANAVLASL
jgi:hypothetical protein